MRPRCGLDPWVRRADAGGPDNCLDTGRRIVGNVEARLPT